MDNFWILGVSDNIWSFNIVKWKELKRRRTIQKKFWIFFIWSPQHQIFRILVPTPYTKLNLWCSWAEAKTKWKNMLFGTQLSWYRSTQLWRMHKNNFHWVDTQSKMHEIIVDKDNPTVVEKQCFIRTSTSSCRY